MNTLAIDIGGSGLKATVLDAKGRMRCERARIATPVGARPARIVSLLAELARDLPPFDRVSVGFPGMVRDGRVLTAPNLGNDLWRGFPLASVLGKALRAPVRLANDADVHGFAVIAGRGLELVVTLGTGFGTALYEDGRLCPHLEISQMPFRKGETYDEQLGNHARKVKGDRKWEKRVWQAIENLRVLTTFDRLYIGGGNADKLREPLPKDVTIVDNHAGLCGGVFLWREASGKARSA